jgi:nuclear pore complex protein Nup205
VTGKLKVEGQEFQINEAFQQSALQVADALDIDEVEAAKLLLEAQTETPLPGQSYLFVVVTNFHDQRELLVQCLRLVLRESQEHEDDDGQQRRMQDIMLQILDIKNGAPNNGSGYARKCMTTMSDIENWQTRLFEQAQKATVLGSSQGPEILAILEIQRSSLSKQHEALGASLCYLFRGNYTTADDLRKLLEVPKRFDRIDLALVHYLPAFSAAFAQYGSSDRSASLEEAQSLHKAITAGDLKSSGSLPPLLALLWLWWICEYSSWYREGMISVLQRDLDHEAAERTKLAKTALNDGALTLLLSICANMANDEWHHPARQELVTLLLSDGSYSALEGEPPSTFFQLLFMECLESFSESWITNMPDSIRQLKSEEDDRRLQHITAMQEGLGANLQRDFDVRLHLECFLVLISFAFEHRPEAAEAFWADPDGNLYGFLQWASKRQTVPRVSAFCEMLCSISEGEECAAYGHRFLLDESSTSSVRLRKSPSMNYAQMFAELELYAFKVNERSSPTHDVPNIRKILATDMNELESPVMLSCYLRLIAHLCKESSAARLFILEHPSFSLVQTVLILCSGPVPSYLRASVFATLEALLVAKSTALGCWMWTTIDQWAANGASSLAPNLPKPPQSMNPPSQALRQTLEAIAISFDQYSAFTLLLRTLITPSADQTFQHALPFPEDFGATYRMPGIEPYVDLVCGTLFAKKLLELPDETQIKVFRFHCLDFMATSLETFNENLVAVANQSRLISGGDSFVTDYAQRHPFSRVMEWLFNEEVVRGLLSAMYLQFDELESLPSDAIEVVSLARCLDTLNVAFDLQPTYLEIVRPLVRKSGRYSPVAASAISTLEDVVAGHPKMVSDLAKYAGTGHDRIVLKSLALLQKLSSSTKLNAPNAPPSGKPSKTRRIVDMVGYESNSDLVSLALASRMQTDVRELENGPDSPGYNIKDGALAFLNTCLATQNDLPSVAHLFLGFTRVGDSLVVGPDSPLETGRSLCNAIIDLVENYPDGEDTMFVSWLMHIKTSAFQVLRQLWTLPLSSTMLITELRRIRFLSSQFAKQTSISSETLWDGRLLSDLRFWVESSADALAEFLGYRNFLYDYAVTEMRSAMHVKSTSLRTQILSTLQGTSTDPVDGTTVAHTSIFDLFDFASMDIGRKFDLPELRTLPLPDLASCITASSEDSKVIYDLQAVEELVQLAFHQSSQKSKPISSTDEERMKAEAELVLNFVKASNRWTLVRMARRQALRMWAEVVIVIVQFWPSDPTAQTQFALTAMQLINPKLDAFLVDEVDEATELLRLADVLAASLATIPPSSMHGRTSKVVIDRQLQLFRTCILGIPAPNTTPTLRGLFYGICAQYLSQVKKVADTIPKARRHCVDCVKGAGVPLINMLSDDAENGQENCRLSAFVLLALLTDVARQERSAFVVETFVKINMLEVLLDSIKVIAIDLQETDPKGLSPFNLTTWESAFFDLKTDRTFQIKILQARLALLLEISWSRSGAGYLLDAGLLQAVRDSGLCQADPDLGFGREYSTKEGYKPQLIYTDVETSVALQTYYELLASMLRLLVSVFLSRGQQNQQSQYQMRNFLKENRANMVGAFKRYRGIGGEIPPASRPVLEDVVKSYVALMSMADFMQVWARITIFVNIC